MKKRIAVAAAVVAGLAATMLSAPVAQAVGGLVPDAQLAECIGLTIGDVTGTTPNYATNGITQADFDRLAAAGGITGHMECSDVANLTGIQYLTFQPAQSDNYDDVPGVSVTAGTVSDLSPLSGMTQLQFLDLSDNNITNISALTGLTRLNFLFLSSNKISDISTVAGMTKLQEVELDGNMISDISPLNNHNDLAFLYLTGNVVSSLPTFTGLPSLSAIALDYNLLTSITKLAGLPALDNVNVAGNKIVSLTGLPKSLRTLRAAENQISDLSPLSALSNLDFADLSNNKIKDLSPLTGLKALEEVIVAHNAISDLKPLASLSASDGGGQADVSQNHVTDLTPLKPCTRAQVLSGKVASCTTATAVAQTLTASATVGTAQALPTIKGQSDDPVKWTVVKAGTATISGSKVTFKSSGTVKLRFMDRSDTGADYAITVASKTECADQGGTWSGGNCTVKADFSGVVTYTVAKAPAKYTVTFNPNGGSTPKVGSKVIKTKTVTTGKTFGTLPSTAKKGYTMAGWFTAKSGGTLVTSSTTVNIAKNTTLYAHWTAKKYTVKLNPRSGTVSPTSITVTYAKKYVGLPTPTRAGYTFKGWFTKTSGGTKVTSSTTVKITKTQTLYAQWAAKKYKITFDPNGGSTPKTGSKVTKSKTVTFAKAFGALPTTKWAGHTFAGWWTDPVAGTKVTAKSKVSILQNTTLYARWV